VSNIGKNHIYLNPENFSDTKPYDYPGGLSSKPHVPSQNRASHSAELREQAKNLKREMAAAIALQKESKSILDRGLIVEFESFESIGEAFEEKSFGKDIELFNIRYANNKTYATVFIPEDSMHKFENKINAYFLEKKRIDGQPLDYQPLIDTIANFKKATIKALWTDTIPLPENREQIFCWEVWLTVRSNRQNQLNGFKALAKKLNIETSNNHFEFKERTVLLIRATTKQLELSLDLLNNIAELRKAKTTADFFSEMKVKEQKEWLADLQKRILFPKETDKTPFICILDTGINSAHPLIEKFIGVNDLHTINEAWGKADEAGHGTSVAGLALYGDLVEVLETKEQIEIGHRLESSKIIKMSEYAPDDTKRPLDLYADFTKQGIAQVEITSANRNRIFQMAITTTDSRDRGKPSSWSAALDMLAVGMDNDSNKRLFIIAAGNFNPYEQKGTFPYSNMMEGIRDPGQAWNVITVGAYTEKDLLSDDEKADGNILTASHGNISPYTTTSHIWDSKWPLKPDIVMEGGNTVENKQGKFQANSLSLLTTNYKFQDKLFTTIWATSAASVLVSKICA